MKTKILTYYIAAACVFAGCGKDFLDIKRVSNQTVPVLISDYQAILDNYDVFNQVNALELALIGSDEYTISDVRYNALSQAYQKNAYMWSAGDIFEGGESNDWNWGYQQILHANLALDVEKISPRPSDQDDWNTVKGTALFYRSLAFFQLAELFCRKYDPNSANRDMGIPLRLDYDIQVRIGRGTVKELYEQILADLKQSAELLPERSVHKFRPGKNTVYALLARVYLQMGDYERSAHYAEESLKIYDELLDYNSLDETAAFTFPENYGEDNPEVIFFQRANATIINSARLNVARHILDSYEATDLRAKLYFTYHADNRVSFKGSYSGPSGYFVGIAVDELYLIAAESRARLNNLVEASAWLNKLLAKRHNDSFEPLQIAGQKEFVDRILLERQKQLFMRGLRWYDMRRLTTDAEGPQIYFRIVDGKRYELIPTSARWIWPLPQSEIELGDVPQNEE
ncbi:RagB/SusD family nutrient uptake outer membrane protein [Sphingobacterium alkalisoli]|uniref:RagB/SusD family nutrient uptake outer membrane protein n=1 Tax=Sphingobacterium alkalisoli TaxID=1874115 RepID=A0A4U0GUV1_9SPHI|nr:RagB/SusD family nutrient uptake outer membrane protein [Sphingobacterium alkalisoli]TJY62777.1 RagB/SusD family nutrient uptake outer membrane protein [Sphingobacterium alkalisoli]GGH28837.1 hypothetical protein GCM10011418_39710 [Sphingobacterium alkalisoli]